MKTIKCKVLAGGTGSAVRATKIEGGINTPNSNMDIPFQPFQNHIAGELTEREANSMTLMSPCEKVVQPASVEDMILSYIEKEGFEDSDDIYHLSQAMKHAAGWQQSKIEQPLIDALKRLIVAARPHCVSTSMLNMRVIEAESLLTTLQNG